MAQEEGKVAHEKYTKPRHSLFYSAREEVEKMSAQQAAAPTPNRFEALQDESIYFSRRAQQENEAAVNATSRRCRNLHRELAQAYEFRAHIITQELLRQDTELLFCAL
jgi:hypothetical protein